MSIDNKIVELKSRFNIIAIIDLNQWHVLDEKLRKFWLQQQLAQVKFSKFDLNSRIIYTLSDGDRYISTDDQMGTLLLALKEELQYNNNRSLVILLTTDQTMFDACNNELTIEVCEPKTITKQIHAPVKHAYNSSLPLNVDWDMLPYREQYLLTESPTFCIYPWIHFHAYPTGAAHVCCMADMGHPIGNTKINTFKEIWNDQPLRDVRKRMLTDQPVSACSRCYEQEKNGFMSGRQSANKHHGQHIYKVANTDSDGKLEKFELTYWDIRFSNLCNLSCRSCGYIFSSSWYQDQVSIAGQEWAKNNKPMTYAGRFEIDAFEQLLEHIDYVDQIYFAGGEPLLMEEHYLILEELVKREKFNVRLIYNTNFTHTRLKNKSVFEYWKLFNRVSVGASLDAMGKHAEYIRKGTNWAQVEKNRYDMIDICPKVDFYISPTLSVMNALHLPDFHKDWVDKGLIRPDDLNVNILQDPMHYRLDIMPIAYKERIKERYLEHLEWLRPIDQLSRASVGFESAINFMMATDNSHLLKRFWERTHELDSLRRENLLESLPELEAFNEATTR